MPKIDALPAATSVTSDDYCIILNAPATVPVAQRATLAQLRTSVLGGGSGYTATDPLTCGAISASGDFAIATSKFTVAAASGNTVVAGTLGIGVTPTASANGTVIEMAGGSAIYSRASTGVPQTYISSNAVGTGYAPTYKVDGYAAQYVLQGFDGSHAWNIAASGVAGAAITFTTAMSLSAAGNLNIATTTQSTSTTTGALVVSGGLGVAKDAFLGGTLSVTGTSTLTGNCGIGEASTATSVLHIKKASLPTSAAGLATGDVWNNSGVLTIV